MSVVFQHLRDTKNLGDRWCSPYDWLSWPSDYQAKDIREPGQQYELSIIGGGKIFGGLKGFSGVQHGAGQRNIAWGVSTVQSFPISPKYAFARRICDLVGTRDWGDRRFTWAPCASCMAPHFDEPPEAQHDVVFYFHGGKTVEQGIVIPNDIPSLSNNAASLDEALSFIGSGKTVVSNSYHGVYWALLMGRKVLCVPFSNKFNNYRKAPAYAQSKDWISKIETAVCHPEMLALCREATFSFEKKVKAVISEYKGLDTLNVKASR